MEYVALTQEKKERIEAACILRRASVSHDSFFLPVTSGPSKSPAGGPRKLSAIDGVLHIIVVKHLSPGRSSHHLDGPAPPAQEMLRLCAGGNQTILNMFILYIRIERTQGATKLMQKFQAHTPVLHQYSLWITLASHTQQHLSFHLLCSQVAQSRLVKRTYTWVLDFFFSPIGCTTSGGCWIVPPSTSCTLALEHAEDSIPLSTLLRSNSCPAYDLSSRIQ